MEYSLGGKFRPPGYTYFQVVVQKLATGVLNVYSLNLTGYSMIVASARQSKYSQQ